jgi:hypothetical protein
MGILALQGVTTGSMMVDPDVDLTKGNLSRTIAAVRQDDVQWH